MTQLKNKMTKKELIHDPSFLQWCLAPTEELDIVWGNYLKAYPDEKKILEQTKETIRSVKLNSYKLTEADKQSLKQSIARDLILRKQAKRKRQIWQYAAAACLFIVCLSGGYWFMEQDRSVDMDAALMVHDIQIDTTQTEVELQLTTQKKVQITDKATIRVNEKGKVQIAEADIAEVKEVEQKNENQVSMNTLMVPKGRHSSVILSDGTKVWVNSGSILRFPEQFDKDKRTIYVEGEIYLEVKKDASRPFYVKTTQMDVRVLGTAFNVVAYTDETEQAVILKEGSVSVDNRSGGEKIIKPNEKLILNDKQMSVSRVNVYDYISWIDGVLQFSQKDLGEILHRLSRFYRVEFNCSPDVRNQMCSGKLVLFDNVEQVLQTLEKSFGISYKINGNEIKLSMNQKNDLPMK